MTLTPAPRGKLKWILDDLRENFGQAVDPLVEHLTGETPAEWLAETLRECGYDISASSIRTYRRSLRAATTTEGGVQVE